MQKKRTPLLNSSEIRGGIIATEMILFLRLSGVSRAGKYWLEWPMQIMDNDFPCTFVESKRGTINALRCIHFGAIF